MQDLFISEATITGESAILEQTSKKLFYDQTKLNNIAFMATTIISGKGEDVVLRLAMITIWCTKSHR